MVSFLLVSPDNFGDPILPLRNSLFPQFFLLVATRLVPIFLFVLGLLCRVAFPRLLICGLVHILFQGFLFSFDPGSHGPVPDLLWNP